MQSSRSKHEWLWNCWLPAPGAVPPLPCDGVACSGPDGAMQADAAILPPVVAFALSHGLSEAQVEEAIGTSWDVQVRARERLPVATLMQLLERTSTMNSHVAVPLNVATFACPSFGAGLAYSAQFAPSVRTALRLFVRYGSLIADGFRIDLDERADGAVFAASHPMSHIDDGRFVELMILYIWRLVLSNAEVASAPLGVAVHRSRGKFQADYEAFFGAPISFSQKGNHTVLRLSPEVLRAPLRFQCSSVFEPLVKQHTSELLERQFGSDSDEIAQLQHAVAINVQEGRYDVAALAKTAGMSVRRAQRLAARSNVSLREVLAHSRMDVAKDRLITEPALAITELAGDLNYSDERSFRRAFKRHTGLSPASFRRRHHDHVN